MKYLEKTAAKCNCKKTLKAAKRKRETIRTILPNIRIDICAHGAQHNCNSVEKPETL